MPKYLNLHIDEPCHENWDGMTQESQGRFCGSCQKTVVDFTEMTDAQVLNYFKSNTGNTCGRFHNDQLDNPILIPKKRIPWLKYFFTITLPAFLINLKVEGQKRVNDFIKVKVENKKQQIVKNDSLKVTTLDTVIVKGYPDRAIRCGRQIGGAVSVTMGSTRRGKNVSHTNTIKKTIKKENNFTIYSNPISAGSSLNILFQYEITGKHFIEVHSFNGTLVQKEILNLQVKNKNASFILGKVTKGFYVLSITDAITNKKISKQFIVQ